jgi:histidine triad (HIT) family protein
MELKQDCLFCKIVRQEMPAKRIAETENIVAFPDIVPGAPTHILIIPKLHIASGNDLNLEHKPLLGEIILLAKDLAKQQNIHDTGFRLVLNTGSAAGQSVQHIHFHLLGGREMGWPPG